MNATTIKGRVNQIRGGFRARFCRLTGNRIGFVSGELRSLMGSAQVSYGRAKGATRKLIA